MMSLTRCEKREGLKMQVSKADIEMLEAFVDKYGIADVLSALSYICGEKAEHVSTNWQDAPLGKRWLKLAALIDLATAKAEQVPG
jgi:hypothetical protein